MLRRADEQMCDCHVRSRRHRKDFTSPNVLTNGMDAGHISETRAVTQCDDYTPHFHFVTGDMDIKQFLNKGQNSGTLWLGPQQKYTYIYVIEVMCLLSDDLKTVGVV